MKRILAVLFLSTCLGTSVNAADSFVIRDIRVEGLQRIAAGTVFNYLPVKIGDTITERDTQEALRALFKTGFFRDVRLERQGDVLIVSVVERPSIASISIRGTDEFSEEDLKKALKEIGLAEGRVFNKSIMDRVEQEMRQQYFARGYYAVSIKPTVTPLERNRVGIQFDVAEGKPARIREINLVGNSIYPDKKLLDLFILGPAPWYAFFSSADQYSKQKLSGDIETLRNYYQDQGYLEFNVDSTQVSITPDKENIYITINITEGKNTRSPASSLPVPSWSPKKNSRSWWPSSQAILFRANCSRNPPRKFPTAWPTRGYAFANVNAIPEINKETSEVFLPFLSIRVAGFMSGA